MPTPDYRQAIPYRNAIGLQLRSTSALDRGNKTADPICVIIDFHTHIFPPEVRENREEYIRRDVTFAEMYSDPRAKLATSYDLLESMERAEVDVSVALGFAWADHELIQRHNEYLLESAHRSRGRIIPFATVNMADERTDIELERCANAGARGLGELRPDSQGWDLLGEPGERLASHARHRGLILSFHVTEIGGHPYSGKDGCALIRFHAFALRFPDLTLVGAHLGGAVYSDYADLAPESDAPAVYVDTAAQPFLYPVDKDPSALTVVPAERLLFGSDFPLITQERQIGEIQTALHQPDRKSAALGQNAARLLGLPH